LYSKFRSITYSFALTKINRIFLCFQVH